MKAKQAVLVLLGLGASLYCQDAPSPYRFVEYKSIRDYFGPIMCVKFFKKNPGLVTGGKDKIVRFWSGADGRQLKELRGHKGWVLALSISPEDELVASASADGLVNIWRRTSGELVKTITTSTNPYNYPLSVAFHPKEKRLAVGMRDGNLIEYDSESGQQLFSTRAAGALIWSVAYSPDGKQIAASGYEEINAWDLATGELVRTFGKHPESDVTAIAFNHDGSLLASGGTDHVVRIWCTKTGKQLAVMNGHEMEILSLAFDHSGQRLATGGGDAVLNIWDVKSGGLERKVEGHQISVSSVDFSFDDKMIATSSLDGTVRVWSAEDGKEIKSWKGHGGFLYSVVFSPDGGLLAAAGVEFMLKMWNTNDYKLEKKLATKDWDDTLFRIAFHPSQPAKLTVGYKNGKLKLWNFQNESVEDDRVAHRGKVWGLTYVSGSKYLVTCGEDSYVLVWNLATKQPPRHLQHDSAVLYVAAHPKKPVFASCDQQGIINIWTIDEKKRTWMPKTILAHERDINCVQYNPDGSLIASAGVEGSIKLWNSETDKLERELRGHEGEVKMIAFHPDGEYLASCGVDRTVRVWRVADGACVAVLGGYQDDVSCLAWNPDGTLLATGAWDGEIKIWQRVKR